MNEETAKQNEETKNETHNELTLKVDSIETPRGIVRGIEVKVSLEDIFSDDVNGARMNVLNTLIEKYGEVAISYLMSKTASK